MSLVIKRKNIIIVTILLVIIVALVLFTLFYQENVEQIGNSIESSDFEDTNNSYNTQTATYISLSGNSATVENGVADVGSNKVTLSAEGVYVLSGDYTGSINVDSQKNIRIVLNNVTINSSNGPAIYVINSEKTIITSYDDTTNILTDTTNYSDSESTATIYSKDDIVFNGNGTLNVVGNYQDGIVGKDDLKVICGTYDITAMNNALKGKDSVEITDGTFTISAQNDAIKTSNDTDSSKGYIRIENGIFNIESEHDGIQAETTLEIINGEYNIKSGGGNANSSKVGTQSDIFLRGDWKNAQEDTTDTTESYKGIKSGTDITITSGIFSIDSADDSIHSNGTINISNGEFNITSGDDGIHADESIQIDNGTITINKSFEGIESDNITINGGDISIVSSDDGINVSGGNDMSAMNGRPGQNTFSSSSSSNKLIINGGNIYINATGDGLDANGSIYINSGSVIVDGPTDGANGALDYDGECVVEGGSLIAVGSSQMAQNISQNSTINCISATVSTQNAGSTITITDENGNQLISHTPAKTYQSIVIASDTLKKGTTYNLNVNESNISSFSISNVITNIGNGGNNFNNIPAGRR